MDDEIYGGNALKAVMRLLVTYKNKHDIKDDMARYIVAEDQGVSSEFSIPNVKTKFYSFEIGIDGMSNVLTYFLPLELENPIEEALGDRISAHTVINILLGLPIRNKEENITKPEFSYKYNERASQKINNLTELQNQAYGIVNNLLEKGIEEYKNNKFSLPFQSNNDQ